MNLSSIDPEWAWRPYEPDVQRPWNRRRATHLYRRAGFSANESEIDKALQSEPAALVHELVNGGSDADSYRRDSEQLAETILATGDAKQLAAWWVYAMLKTPRPLEKSTLFWHGHFATSAEKVQDVRLMYNQNRLLREHALGDFKALVRAVSRDPAMLIYLDSAANRKARPNENYARELLELFCLGEGNYSESDVRQLARCFTGWEIRRGRFRFNRYEHDSDEKKIFGKTDKYPGDSAIDLVFQQPTAASFVVGKLIRYFLFDEPQPTDELAAPLANDFRQHDWKVGPVLQRMLGSNLFFSEHVMGRKVRSPVETGIGLLRALEGSTNAHALAEDLFQLGQGLFYPPNVQGWEGGRGWINSSTLLSRANMVRRILLDENTRFGGTDLASYFASLGAESSEAIVDTFLDLTFAVPLSADLRAELVRLVGREEGDPSARIARAVHAASTLPEFQLC